MSLYDTWKEMAYNHRTRESFDTFWDHYGSVEKGIYEDVLNHKQSIIEGCIKDLAQKYDTSHEYIIGFLDGINESVVTPLNLEELTEDSEVKVEIDYEKLYYNMRDAKAEELYELPQWETILDEETRKEITKKQRKSKTIVKKDKVGRNDPCPCGSGKKYKKCCGK